MKFLLRSVLAAGIVLFILYWFMSFHLWNIIASIIMIIWFFTAEIYLILNKNPLKKRKRIELFLIGSAILIMGLVLGAKNLPSVGLICYAGASLIMITKAMQKSNAK